jgi:hypothetical protein
MSRRWATIIIASGLAAASSASAARDGAQQLPGFVAPAPNACLPGTSSHSWCGDGGLATHAKLAFPTDVAVAADGTLVIADAANNVVRRVTPDGVIGTLAGNGIRPSRGPRSVEPAARPRFKGPGAVALAPDGTVLVADSGNSAIRRISHDGRVTVVLGGPSRIGTRLLAPVDVAALPNGDVVAVDSATRRVWLRTAAGAIVPLAGTGGFGSTGDGGMATAATFESPTVLATQVDGGLLIGDWQAGTVRRVDPTGVITTVARVPARSLEGIAEAADGSLLVALSGARTEILRFGPVESRIAGTGRAGFTGDGPATAVALDQPQQLAIAPDGTLLVADAGNDRIRRLTADGQLATVAGSDRPGGRIASLPAPPVGTPGPPPHANVPPRARTACYDRHPRFEIFNFLPGDKETLATGRRKITLRIQTSVTARVVVVIRRGRHGVRRRVLERVSNAREFTPVKLRLRLIKASRYFAEMDGRSLQKPAVYRCDRRRVRLR